jgi:hypothetical protein
MLEEYYILPRGEKGVDYQRFFSDLKDNTVGGTTTMRVALTRNQEELIASAKQFIQYNKDSNAKLMNAFKHKDHSNKGYLSIKDIGACAKEIGLSQ